MAKTAKQILVDIKKYQKNYKGDAIHLDKDFGKLQRDYYDVEKKEFMTTLKGKPYETTSGKDFNKTQIAKMNRKQLNEHNIHFVGRTGSWFPVTPKGEIVFSKPQSNLRW